MLVCLCLCAHTQTQTQAQAFLLLYILMFRKCIKKTLLYLLIYIHINIYITKMAWACQRNSYLKELVSKVVSCVKIKDGFEVILNDTVLFPEGGGQPYDKGFIGSVEVSQVNRHGSEAVHITKDELTVGEEYKCSVDWKRRFDHMQQHSAQHLLSAIIDLRYGFKTLSWDLGKNLSHVELNTQNITAEQINTIEIECNEHIRNNKHVIVHYLSKEESLQLKEVKTRGLPDDVVEPIRVIEINGVEKNMCCGTHVSNLSDLQVMKLLHTETMRGNTRLFFLAGSRVVDKLFNSYDIERKLNKLLSCGYEDYVDTVEKLKNNLRLSQKSCRSYLKEIAKFEVGELIKMYSEDGYIFKHREDGDMDYIFTILNSLPQNCDKSLVFICGGSVKSGGQFVLRGPEEKVKELSPSILQLIDGKGGGKKGQLQGKAASFKKLSDVHELIKKNVQTNIE